MFIPGHSLSSLQPGLISTTTTTSQWSLVSPSRTGQGCQVSLLHLLIHRVPSFHFYSFIIPSADHHRGVVVSKFTRPAVRKTRWTFATLIVGFSTGMGTYAGAARRRVPPCDGTPWSSVWPSPRQTPGPPCPYPSDRPPPDATMKRVDAPRHGPAPRLSTTKHPMGGILRRESRHMPIEA